MIRYAVRIFCILITTSVITYCAKKPEEAKKPKAEPLTENQKKLVPQPKFQTEPAPPQSIMRWKFQGNTKSKIFHSPECPAYDCPNCTIGFLSKRHAKRRGFKPHKCIEPKKYKRKRHKIKKGPP